MTKIIDWRIRRSSDTMTITGTDTASGKPVRITGVETIYAGRRLALSPGERDLPTARDRDGNVHELA